jgi:O-acetyl-ADP-ribose deacetylase (regulator of RNase III)
MTDTSHYQEIRGNIFNSNAQALVNTVNCVGVMGKGIALEFRRRYPDMFRIYKLHCKQGILRPGHVYHYKVDDGQRVILNFAIKGHWRFPSREEWIESSLQEFVATYRTWEVNSVAFPWMGALNGGLSIDRIQSIMRHYLRQLPDLRVEVYDFDPSISDPLFESLKIIVKSLDIDAFAQNSRIRKDVAQRMIELVTSKQVSSLYELENGGYGIGEASINSLYSYLTQAQHKHEPPVLTAHPVQHSFL